MSMFKLLMIQADIANELDALATEAPDGISIKFFDLALKGGWIMVPIILLSFIAVYIFFDRYFAIRKASKFDTALLDKIKVYITNGKIDDALLLCRGNSNPASKMLEENQPHRQTRRCEHRH